MRLTTPILDAHGIRSSVGAVMLGGMISIFLSGAVTMQVLLYYKIYAKDRRRLKISVGLIWFLDLIHTCMVCASNWNYLIAHFGDHSYPDTIPWTVAVTVALTAVVTFFVHLFFSYRIFTLSKGNWHLTTIIAFFAAFRLSCALVSTSEMIELQSYSEFVLKFSWVFTMGLSLASAVDIMITLAMCWLLHKSRTEFSSMNGIIDSITLYTIQNGMLTCMTTIVSLICWVTMPHNLVFLGLHFAISKLYANAFLASLNARKTFGEPSHGSSDGDIAMSVLFPENFGYHGQSGQFLPQLNVNSLARAKVQINVEKTVECDTDGESSESIFPPSDPGHNVTNKCSNVLVKVMHM